MMSAATAALAMTMGTMRARAVAFAFCVFARAMTAAAAALAMMVGTVRTTAVTFAGLVAVFIAAGRCRRRFRHAFRLGRGKLLIVVRDWGIHGIFLSSYFIW
jgi:hypothetical protein